EFTSVGQLVASHGSLGGGPGEIVGPGRLAFRNGVMALLDGYTWKLQAFTSDAVAPVPASIALQSYPSSTSCYGSTLVSVAVYSSPGQLLSANVSLQVSSGSAPSSAQTVADGGALFYFPAAGSAGTATITATAGSVQQTFDIPVTCGP